MKTKTTYKIINIILILTIFSHLSFFHEYLQNYVICYEIDGNVQIENINDCEECTNINLVIPSSMPEESTIKNIDCLDIPLEANCFNDQQFISRKNKVNITKSTILSVQTFIAFKKENIFTTTKNLTFNNHILDNYLSVLLII
jgi:hypothetical protein